MLSRKPWYRAIFMYGKAVIDTNWLLNLLQGASQTGAPQYHFKEAYQDASDDTGKH